jgi:hypothetical protein
MKSSRGCRKFVSEEKRCGVDRAEATRIRRRSTQSPFECMALNVVHDEGRSRIASRGSQLT